jgi:endonuclease/exonuclease/phosphatase (EEP) superfamily protein YafD
MKNYFFILFSLIISGCAALPEPVFSPKEGNLRVVTYNVNWGGADPDKIAGYLDQADADLIFLQETHRQWEDYFKKHLNHRYRYFLCNITFYRSPYSSKLS